MAKPCGLAWVFFSLYIATNQVLGQSFEIPFETQNAEARPPVLNEKYVESVVREQFSHQRVFKSRFDSDSKQGLSDRYKSGSYLIYDCSNQFFACVDRQSYQRCVFERETALNLEKAYLPCAPLRKMGSEASCHVDQKFRLSNTPKRLILRVCSYDNSKSLKQD